MAQTQISLDTAILDQLDATAASLSLSREDALREAIENLATWGARFREDVEAGIASGERGELLSSEVVEEEFRGLRAAYSSKVEC